MKPLYCLLSLSSILCSIQLFGQDSSRTKDFDLFEKGENSYQLNEKGYYGRMTYLVNDQKMSRSNATYLDLDWYHSFGNGLGAGLDLSVNWSGTHYFNSNTDQKYRNWSIAPTVGYGKMLSDDLGVYLKADVLLGKGKDIYKTPSVTNTDKSDLFGFGGRVGIPYKLWDYTTLTAELSYDHLRTKYGDISTENENGYGANLFLQDYRRCNQMRCDCHNGYKFSKDEYQQGDGFINYETAIGYNAGNNKQTYTNPNITYKSKFNNWDANVNGSYYIIDGISLGGRINLGRTQTKSDDNTFQNTFNYIRFDPEAIIHVPTDNNLLRNVFIKGGGYFGSQRSEVRSGPTTNTDKDGITGFNVGAGYYSFFAEETALQTCIYYRSTTFNDKNSTAKATNKGLAISVGLVHSF